ncbi:hypothetical protein [Helicobacter suis]|uniref:hypothetical protein n=1 Tax=Helicobacter suis TaxID=104628 RepID=UPI001596DD29|nr:hypothetical protein [Helicobacter suis]
MVFWTLLLLHLILRGRIHIVTTLAPALDKPEKVKKLVMEIVKEVETRGKDKPDGYHK